MKDIHTFGPRHAVPAATRDSLARDILSQRAKSEADLWRADSLRADLAGLAQYAKAATGADAAAIAIEENGEVVCRARAGECAPAIGAHLDPASGISGLCLRTRRPVGCDDAEQDTRVNIEAARSLGIRSMLAVPLLQAGSVAGLVEVFSFRPRAFDVEQQATLKGAADLIIRTLGPERSEEDAAFLLALEKVRASEVHVGSSGRREPAECGPVAVVGDASIGAPRISVLERYSEVEHVEGRRVLAVFAATIVVMLSAGLWVWRGTASASRKQTAAETVEAAKKVPELASLLTRVNSGDAKAALALAHEYERGEKLPRNTEAAVMWLQRAAEEGDASAQYELAMRQFDGNGTKKDEASAAEWLQKAARQGNGNAQLGLGKAYADGRGVTKDAVSAYACFALASDLGNKDAQAAIKRLEKELSRAQIADARTMVARMYAAGIGVPINNTAAYTWLTLAESAGSKKASQEKRVLVSKLSGAEAAGALRRAQEWQRNLQR